MPQVGAGVATIRKQGDTPLDGDVELAPGANVTITQSGQVLTIASTGGGGAVEIKESGVQKVASASAIDFGAGFAVTEAPSGEANVTPDFAEAAPTHAQLGGVTADQHHVRQHAIDAALDHTGTITDAQHGVRTLANAHPHADLSGVTSDQHHTEAHGNEDHTAAPTPTTSIPGDAAAVGTDAGPARGDHRHGREGVTSPYGLAVQSGNFILPATMVPANLTEVLVADLIRAFPVWIARGVTAISIRLPSVTLADGSGAVRLAIYSMASNNFYPGALLLDCGTVVTTSTGAKVITISQALAAETWYWVVLFSNSTATVRAAAVNTNLHTVMGFALADPTGASGVVMGYSATYAYPGSAPDPFPDSINTLAGSTRASILIGI